MTRITLLIIITALVISACNDPNNHPISSQTTVDNQTRKNNISGYVAVNGLIMSYEIDGSGEPLVLIHGGGSTIHTTFG